MKRKLLFGVIVFSLIMASCQKNEVIDDVTKGDNQLSFGVFQGKATKASELTDATLKTGAVASNPIAFYAYKGLQNTVKTSYFIEDLIWNGTKTEWDTKIPHFLPEGDPLQFYAFYPTTDLSTNKDEVAFTDVFDVDKYPTLSYKIQQNAADAAANPSGTDIDLIAAAVNDNYGTDVLIPMKHILSQVNFGVKGYYGAKIAIDNIKIEGVNTTGTFTFDPNNWGWTGQSAPVTTAYTYSSFETFETPGFYVGADSYTDADKPWTNSTDLAIWQSSTTKENVNDFTYVLGDGGQCGPGKGATAVNIWYVNNTNGDKTQGSTITEDAATNPKLSNSLMLMPQEFTNPAMKVTFDYAIRDLDGAYIIGNGTPAKGEFFLNFTEGNTDTDYQAEWKPNMRYLYVIDFKDYLDGKALSFTVDVNTQPWENYNSDGDDDGIILLDATGEPIFTKSIKPLTNGGNYDIKASHVFTDIAWDWSNYVMGTQFTADQTFTVKFAAVRFNGHKITVKAPFGFEVSNDATTYGASAEADAAKTTLTFKLKTAVTNGYYATSTTLNNAITTNQSYSFYASNDIVLKDLTNVSLIKGSNKVIITFVTPYNKTLSTGWALDATKKIATYTVPAP